MRLLFIAVVLLISQFAHAERDERIQVSIEEPAQGERYSGISNLRGWAVSPEGMGRYYLTIYIDDEFAFYLVPYGKRTDVGNAFPDYPDSDTGGFSMAYNYKNLSPGEHEIRVRAYDDAGNYNEAVTTFITERFETEFIASDSDVDVSTSETWYIVDKQTYLVSGATLEGKQWDFLLRWDRASQSFKMEEITAKDDEGASSGGNSSGGSSWEVYACVTSPSTSASSTSEFVYFKNGLVIRNNAGDYWSSGQEHVVFKTEDAKWYSIIEQKQLERLDVVDEPTSCFEYDYAVVVDVSLNGSEKIITIADDVGDPGAFDIYTSATCDMPVGSPLGIYETGYPARTYLVDLRDAETCRITDLVEL